MLRAEKLLTRKEAADAMERYVMLDAETLGSDVPKRYDEFVESVRRALGVKTPGSEREGSEDEGGEGAYFALPLQHILCRASQQAMSTR